MSYLLKIIVRNSNKVFIHNDRRYDKGAYSVNHCIYSKVYPELVTLIKYFLSGDKSVVDKIRFYLYDVEEIPKGLNYELFLTSRKENEIIFTYKW
jgi:hypothetical protein